MTGKLDWWLGVAALMLPTICFQLVGIKAFDDFLAFWERASPFKDFGLFGCFGVIVIHKVSVWRGVFIVFYS